MPPGVPYSRCTTASKSGLRAASRIALAEGSGIAASSVALMATLPLMQRITRSAAAVPRKAATTDSGTLARRPAGRTMLRWFSTATPAPDFTSAAGISAAIRRRCCSLAVVRCTSTQGLRTTFASAEPRGSYHARWFFLVAFSTKRPSGVTASAHTTGTRVRAGASCRRGLCRFHTSGPVLTW